MVKRKIILSLFVLLSVFLKGQDIHFTQYYFSPLNLNPAYAGRFDGDFRIVGNYRSQWFSIMDSEQFETTSISFEKNFNLNKHVLSLGGVFVHDDVSVGILQQNKLELTGGYNYKSNKNYLGVGFQIGGIHKGINFNGYSFPNQYDQQLGAFNTSMSNQQNFGKQSIFLLDFNAGFVLGRKFGPKTYSEIGLAVHHINSPTETFYGNDNKLPRRYVVDYKLKYKLSDKSTLVPNALFMYQKGAQDLLFGSLLRYKLNENKIHMSEVFGGVAIRNGIDRNFDSFEVITGAVFGDLQVGISYDVNISDLSSLSNYRGAIEFSIIYVAKSADPKIFIVPCDIL